MAGKGKGTATQPVEPSVSCTLGSRDTSVEVLGPGNGSAGVRNRLHKAPLPSAGPLQNKRVLEGEDCRIWKFDTVNGVAKLGVNDVLEVEDVRRFCLIGRFAGRFPGMEAVEELAASWNINCSTEALLHGHVRFWFKSESDRDGVLSGGPYAVFGKRLFLRCPPVNFCPGYEDYKCLPVWVRLPGLPKACWHENALGIIASCIGDPLYRDRVTKEGKRLAYARILVDVDCSVTQPEHITVILPDGETFEQPISFEHLPLFCTSCGSFKHVTGSCPLISTAKNGVKVGEVECPVPVTQPLPSAGVVNGSVPVTSDGGPAPALPSVAADVGCTGTALGTLGKELVVENGTVDVSVGVCEGGGCSHGGNTLTSGVVASGNNGASVVPPAEENEIDSIFSEAFGVRGLPATPSTSNPGKKKKKKKKNNGAVVVERYDF